MRILGISAFYHDSAAALIEDGRIIAAAQEERFTRKKHDARFPLQAIRYCLEEAGISPEQSFDHIDFIAFYDKPFLKFERLLETYLSFAPRGFESFRMALPLWIGEKLFQKRLLKKEFTKNFGAGAWHKKLLFNQHHMSHAASAFFPSPFEEAVVLTMDGVGEWTTTSAAIGRGNNLTIQKEIHFPHSLGLLYSAFTYFTGFKVNSGEYKLMGLAPYGKPVYTDIIYKNLIDIKADGSFRLNQDYFDYASGLRMTTQAFAKLFGIPARKASETLTQQHMDIAASIQAVTEEIILRLARALRKESGIPNLCLAGGVALNCVANGKILKEKIFENIWIQPAAGDAGGALGAALSAYYQHANQARSPSKGQDAMRGAYLGPKYSADDTYARLKAIGGKVHRLEENAFIEATAQALVDQKAIGWFQGRMEFGPRSLGARSIIADARSPAMQSLLNLKVKFRESFRPFAPAVLRENVSEWFEINSDSPYMLLVAGVKEKHHLAMTEEEKNLFGIAKLNIPRSKIPAVTHVDYSARIQTVHAETNPRFHALLSAFHQKTACPVVVNTSFNVRSEPIVCSPEDAFRCFMGTHLDVLAIENCILYKEEQDQALAKDYRGSFELD